MTYSFDLPDHHKSIIKVVGVGGGGSNAVTHMFNQGIKDVEFVIANTDMQALKSSTVTNKLQLGVTLTEGLGAGANPEVGMNAAMESKEDIRELLGTDTKMVFITAGMGGGTGTGAAPIIASVARELDILTVGIVTIPFKFEGKKKAQYADEGVRQMKEYCDTVLVIINDKLREIYGNLSLREAFSRADNVLTTAAKSIAEIITVTSEINVDFEDVRAVMKNSGAAVMGSAVAEGENRARLSVEQAINSPLLDNTDIRGAKQILLSIGYGEQAELTMDELSEITDYIEEMAGNEADVIWGQGVDPTLDDSIRVTIIATGFNDNDPTVTREPHKTVYDLEQDQMEQKTEEPTRPESTGSNLMSRKPTRSYSFEPPARDQEPQEEEEMYLVNRSEQTEEPADTTETSNPNQVTFEIDGKYEVEEVDKSESQESTPNYGEDIDEKRKILDKQAQERKERLNGLDENQMDPDEFKKRLEVPAYKRRNVNLKDVPHSSEQNVSKYNLNDDNEILGNNKFLHDNVD